MKVGEAKPSDKHGFNPDKLIGSESREAKAEIKNVGRNESLDPDKLIEPSVESCDSPSTYK